MTLLQVKPLTGSQLMNRVTLSQVSAADPVAA